MGAKAPTLDINRLSLEVTRSLIRDGEPPLEDRLGKKRACSDNHSHADSNNSRRARCTAPALKQKHGQDPAFSRGIPHSVPGGQRQRFKTHRQHHDVNTKHQVSSNNSSSTSPLKSPAQPPRHQPGILKMPTDARYPELLLQPDSRPISQEQLAAEVKSIYAGLTMVETKCIHVDKAQAAALKEVLSGDRSRVTNEHWQALIALHRTLLHEHHDFFLASQHPSASPALRRLAAKYSMPARMWKHGIHSFLEILRHSLPGSKDYMLAFIYLAYQMMALLFETVPTFEDTWIECLGDLGRYRMAIEDEDLRDREIWAGVARTWYSKAASKTPSVGRLYHHLAILARPDALQQLYLYLRSLISLQPFPSARESVLTLFDLVMGRAQSSQPLSSEVDASFVRAHSMLFEKSQLESLPETIRVFIGQLDGHINRVGVKWKDQGAFVAIANIASLLGYGSEDAILWCLFQHQVASIAHEAQGNISSVEVGHEDVNSTLANLQQRTDGLLVRLEHNYSSSTNVFPHAWSLTLSTLSVVLSRGGDKNTLPYIHITLVFLLRLVSLQHEITTSYVGSSYVVSYVMSYVASLLNGVPWEVVKTLLNTLARFKGKHWRMESTDIMQQRGGGSTQPLPEDYLLRGQLWVEGYYPVGWLDNSLDEDERMIEIASTTESRIERILWLGIQLSEKFVSLTIDKHPSLTDDHIA